MSFIRNTGNEHRWFDTMQVCENGHIITSTAKSEPDRTSNRCRRCGAKTLMNCRKCQTPIKGYEHIPNVAHGGPRTPPLFCESCGEAFPWREILEGETSTRKKRPTSNDVFVVHGHDNEMKQHVARVLQSLGLNPVILHEKPNRGRTIIEKFEAESNVGFAVVLLSPDDKGRMLNEKSFQFRARQNVILELGYFVGRLGREHVCALKRGSVEVPSDFAGVVYTEYDDAGAWRFELAKELKGSGYSIDLERIP